MNVRMTPRVAGYVYVYVYGVESGRGDDLRGRGTGSTSWACERSRPHCGMKTGTRASRKGASRSLEGLRQMDRRPRGLGGLRVVARTLGICQVRRARGVSPEHAKRPKPASRVRGKVQTQARVRLFDGAAAAGEGGMGAWTATHTHAKG